LDNLVSVTDGSDHKSDRDQVTRPDGEGEAENSRQNTARYPPVVPGKPKLEVSPTLTRP